MIIEGYTPEVFIENLKKDSEVFGEETAIAIYEEIFSTLSGKKIKLEGILDKVRTLEEEVYNEEVLEETNRMAEFQAGVDAASKAIEAAKSAKTVEQAARIGWQGADAWATASDAVLKKSAEAAERAAVLKAGWQGADHWAVTDQVNRAARIGTAKFKLGQLFGSIGNFLKTLPAKVANFFGGLKGKSFGEILSQGAGWLQANPAIALKTTGGIALLFMIIRALKKRGELRKYAALNKIYANQSKLKEDCNDIYSEDTQEKKAMRKIIEECQTNKALNELMFGEIKVKKSDKFNY